MAKNKKFYGSNVSADRNVVEMGGQKGMMMQKDARYMNAFGNMSFDPNGSAGFPTDVRMEVYPQAGQFLALDNDLAGHMGGIDAQMRSDATSVRNSKRPRRI